MVKGKTRSKTKTRSKSKDKLWIQAAKFEKGSLRSYIRAEYGAEGFTERGTIKVEVLNDLKRGKKTPKGHVPSLKTRRRANAALTLRKF